MTQIGLRIHKISLRSVDSIEMGGLSFSEILFFKDFAVPSSSKGVDYASDKGLKAMVQLRSPIFTVATVNFSVAKLNFTVATPKNVCFLGTRFLYNYAISSSSKNVNIMINLFLDFIHVHVFLLTQFIYSFSFPIPSFHGCLNQENIRQQHQAKNFIMLTQP